MDDSLVRDDAQAEAIVRSVGQAVQRGDWALESAQEGLRLLIESGAWRHRYVRRLRKHVLFEDFEDFVTADPLEGMGVQVADLRRLVRLTPTDALLAQALKHKPGPSSDNNIIRTPAIQGTHYSYTLSRLQRERPDLAVRVESNELSANAAALEAGFRKPTATVPVDSAENALRALARRFSREELQRALDNL